jgi:hypothetical protein
VHLCAGVHDVSAHQHNVSAGDMVLSISPESAGFAVPSPCYRFLPRTPVLSFAVVVNTMQDITTLAPLKEASGRSSCLFWQSDVPAAVQVQLVVIYSRHATIHAASQSFLRSLTHFLVP